MTRQRTRSKLEEDDRTNWTQFTMRVLAFIGLWQVLSGSVTVLRHLF